jgi:RNAse (barnase) inhibitor barstar
MTYFYYVHLKNSLRIHEEKTKEITAVWVVLYKKIMLIYINFSFDFLGLRRISSPRTKLLAARCECMHEHFHPITMLDS